MIRVPYTLLFVCFSVLVYSQTKIPVIKSSNKYVTLRDGSLLLKDYWTITPEVNPDVWDVIVPRNTTKTVAFITDLDSISFEVELGESYDFIILLNNKDSAYTRISTHPEPATFSKSYIEKYNYKTIVEIPEMYEFVNVVIALTDKGLKDSNLVIHKTDYYHDVMQWFGEYKYEKVVTAIDSALKSNFWNYFNLKMDAYAYEFRNDKIVQSNVYDRCSWGGKNTLLPYIAELETLAKNSNFKKFYKKQKELYTSQINFYRDSLNLSEMQKWLNSNYPSTSYNCIKVIFSPLVGYSQSANWFENNGFKEAQAHVNFPYSDKSDNNYSVQANNIRKGMIVFTEINHAFINPESEKYTGTPEFQYAFGNIKNWEAENSIAARGYPNAYACFNEYMNWSLVCLRYLEYAPADEIETLIRNVENNQKDARGFTKFPEFNRNVIELYKNRKKGETLADLYPKIIDWCKEQIK